MIIELLSTVSGAPKLILNWPPIVEFEIELGELMVRLELGPTLLLARVN